MFFEDTFENFKTLLKFEPVLVPIRMKENDKEIVVIMQLPGIKKEDIQISFDDNNSLTVNVSKKKTDDAEYAIIVDEIRDIGEIQRKIYFPCEIDCDKTIAKLEDGLLTITLPKRKPEEVKKIIEIK